MGDSRGFNYYFKPIVLITGFGPFIDHPVNASWEAVKCMNKAVIEDKHNVELVLLELSVTYRSVDEFVPKLWETHEPKLMIHVGVSTKAKCLTIEMQARKKGYQRRDYLDECPADNLNSAEGAFRLHTQLDVETICNEFNDPAEGSVKAVSSKDAGSYLCEYIYYTSLSVDNTRTLFIHVPDLKVYEPKQTARALERILDLCLKQLEKTEVTKDVDEVDNLEHCGI